MQQQKAKNKLMDLEERLRRLRLLETRLNAAKGRVEDHDPDQSKAASPILQTPAHRASTEVNFESERISTVSPAPCLRGLESTARTVSRIGKDLQDACWAGAGK